MLAGLFSFASPCVLPLVPAYLSFLGGVGMQGTGAPRAPVRPASAALAFVAGFIVVFVALGASATVLGRVLADQYTLLSRISGIVVIVLGIHYTGLISIPFLNYDARFHPLMRRASLAGAFLVGLAFAFGWTPCVGPVLASVLLVAGRSASIWQGIALLGCYGLGLGIPFLVAAIAVGPSARVMAALKRFIRPIELTMGGVMIATGILIFAGTLSNVSGWLLRLFPGLANVG